jgi:hypothetical protein
MNDDARSAAVFRFHRTQLFEESIARAHYCHCSPLRISFIYPGGDDLTTTTTNNNNNNHLLLSSRLWSQINIHMPRLLHDDLVNLVSSVLDRDIVAYATTNPELAYSSALAVDACLASLRDKTRYNTVVSSKLVVSQTSFAHLLSWFSSFLFYDMSQLEHISLRKVIGKCWPVRCWTRLFGKVSVQEIEGDKNTEYILNHILLCALLGNYKDLPAGGAFRPTSFARQILYDMFDATHRRASYDSPTIAAFRKQLLLQVERVYIHAVQLLLCHFVRCNPVYLELVNKEIPFAEFEARAIAVNQKIRMVFVEHIQQTSGQIESDALFSKLQDVVVDYNASLLDGSYQTPTPPFLEFTLELRDRVHPKAADWFDILPESIRKGRKLVIFQEPEWIKPSEVLAAEAKISAKNKNKDGSVDVNSRSFTDAKSAIIGGQSIENAAAEAAARVDVEREIARLRSGMNDPVPEEDDTQIVSTKMHITMEHSRALEDIIGRYDPAENSADAVLHALLSVLHEGFGSSKKAVHLLRMMWIYYRYLRFSKHEWEEKFEAFYRDFPYTYCLLFAASRLYARHRKIYIFPLPTNVARTQIEAVMARGSFAGGCPIEMFNFMYCSCCQYINSLHTLRKSKIDKKEKNARNRANNKKKKTTTTTNDGDAVMVLDGGTASSLKKQQRKKSRRKKTGPRSDPELKKRRKRMGAEGAKHLRVDLWTNKCYCIGDTVYAHHRCDQQELTRVSLLGQGIRFKGQTYMICCQPTHEGSSGIGFMQVDPLHTFWTANSRLSCVVCTEKILFEQAIEAIKQYPWLFAPQARDEGMSSVDCCFLCEKKLSLKRPFYLMAKDTYICGGVKHRDVIRTDPKRPEEGVSRSMDALSAYVTRYLGRQALKEQKQGNNNMDEKEDSETTAADEAVIDRLGTALLDSAFTSDRVAADVQKAIVKYRTMKRANNAYWRKRKNNWAHRQDKKNRAFARGGR